MTKHKLTTSVKFEVIVKMNRITIIIENKF